VDDDMAAVVADARRPAWRSVIFWRSPFYQKNHFPVPRKAMILSCSTTHLAGTPD
jgi:hypothetical protein